MYGCVPLLYSGAVVSGMARLVCRGVRRPDAAFANLYIPKYQVLVCRSGETCNRDPQVSKAEALMRQHRHEGDSDDDP